MESKEFYYQNYIKLMDIGDIDLIETTKGRET